MLRYNGADVSAAFIVCAGFGDIAARMLRMGVRRLRLAVCDAGG